MASISEVPGQTDNEVFAWSKYVHPDQNEGMAIGYGSTNLVSYQDFFFIVTLSPWHITVGIAEDILSTRMCHTCQ